MTNKQVKVALAQADRMIALCRGLNIDQTKDEETTAALARDLLAAREALRLAVNAAHSAECTVSFSECQDDVCVAARGELGDPR